MPPNVYEMFRRAERIVLRQEGVCGYPGCGYPGLDVSGTRYILVEPKIGDDAHSAYAGFIEMLAGRPPSVEVGDVVFDRQGGNLDPVVWRDGEFPYREIVYVKRAPRAQREDD